MPDDDEPPDSEDDMSPQQSKEADSKEAEASGESGQSKSEQEMLKGKEAYDRGDYTEAVKLWTASLRSVKYLLEKGLYKHNPEHQKDVENMDLRFNLNLAQAHIKLGEFRKAIEFADQALTRDPKSTKALYRKAAALMETLSFAETAEVLQQLLALEPENAAAKDLLAKAKHSAAKGEMRAKRMSQKMLGVSDKPDAASTPSFDQVRHWLGLCCRRRNAAEGKTA
eukprot:TRINITY_DN26509_c0_g1_i2.p1 TRINITY_DN26509_c0_g1~~TRINITY_DN26509_c0_g1_i2.p1  ORF type:complete len:235 (-),score=64.66 TRINITY_DN26509_c0_g1_i2:27-701(-)